MSATLRHALLALLAEKPRSGYDLTRIFDQTLSHAWSAGHSQIYPELTRLLDDGLIRRESEGPRRRKLYEATEAGRVEVRRWLLETPPNRSSRNELALRTFFLWLVPRAERRSFLASQQPYHRDLLDGYERLAAEEDWSSPAAESGRVALEFGILYERAVLEWIDWALARLDSFPTGTRAGAGRRSGG